MMRVFTDVYNISRENNDGAFKNVKLFLQLKAYIVIRQKRGDKEEKENTT